MIINLMFFKIICENLPLFNFTLLILKNNSNIGSLKKYDKYYLGQNFYVVLILFLRTNENLINHK